MNRVAVVTGACSGIGEALVTALLARQARVVGLDVREPKTRGPADERAFRWIGVDVTDRKAVARAADTVVRELGRIDLWINNAGIGVAGELTDIPAEVWQRVIDVNLFGVVHGIMAVLPHLERQGSGHIVNVSSLAGLVPLPGEGPYVASKHAVVGLSRCLRLEAEERGVRVTTVCPGRIETPIYETSAVFGYSPSAVLALWPKGVSPKECAEQILRGVARNDELVIVTRFAQVAAWLYRKVPGLTQEVLRRYWREVRKTRLPSPRILASSPQPKAVPS